MMAVSNEASSYLGLLQTYSTGNPKKVRDCLVSDECSWLGSEAEKT